MVAMSAYKTIGFIGLGVMVGATPALYADIEPLIRCFATDVTHCGEVGAGQITKILNNMVLFETVNALAEAVAVARHNGVDPTLLLDTLSKGSADSFALRNHGMKAIVPGVFPERAFSTEYALRIFPTHWSSPVTPESKFAVRS